MDANEIDLLCKHDGSIEQLTDTIKRFLANVSPENILKRITKLA